MKELITFSIFTVVFILLNIFLDKSKCSKINYILGAIFGIIIST